MQNEQGKVVGISLAQQFVDAVAGITTREHVHRTAERFCGHVIEDGHGEFHDPFVFQDGSAASFEFDKGTAQVLTPNEEQGKVVEQGAFQKVLMYASFEVGALSRDELENLAVDFDIAVNDTLSSDYLRAEVLAKLESQGEPCTQVEYDDNFWGGDYSGVGNHAYVPDALIAAFDGDVDLAFGKLTHKDPIHIVTHTGDQTFSASGQPFVGYDLIVNAQQAANKPQVVGKDMKAKKPKGPSCGMS